MKKEIRYRDKIERIPKGEKYEVFISNDGKEWPNKKDAIKRDASILEQKKHEEIMKTIPMFHSVEEYPTYYIDTEDKLFYVTNTVLGLLKLNYGHKQIANKCYSALYNEEKAKLFVKELFECHGPTCWEYVVVDGGDHADSYYFNDVKENINELKEYINNLRKYGIEV